MEYRVNKKTEEKISIIGLGASSISESKEDEAIETLKIAYENGINYFDLAAAESKVFKYYGEAFKDVRKNIMYQIHFGANYLSESYGWTTNLNIVKKSIEWQLE